MNTRFLIIGTMIVLAVGAGLWSIWLLESGSAAKEGETGDAEFSYPLKKTGNIPADILILCPEEILAEPGEAFSKWLKLDGIPLKIPGGAMVIARLNDLTLEESLKPFQRTAVEVLKRYSPRRVVLVAHTYCIYYDTLAAWNNNLDDVRRRQIADMQAAVRVLAQWLPRAEISGFLAEEDENERLVFHPMDKLTP